MTYLPFLCVLAWLQLPEDLVQLIVKKGREILSMPSHVQFAPLSHRPDFPSVEKEPHDQRNRHQNESGIDYHQPPFETGIEMDPVAQVRKGKADPFKAEGFSRPDYAGSNGSVP